MSATTKVSVHAGCDFETAALLMEAASVVGRPLDGSLRYKLLARARAFDADNLLPGTMLTMTDAGFPSRKARKF